MDQSVMSPEYTPLTSLHSIMQLLERASQSGSGLTFYSPGLCKDEKVSYSQLLEDSRAKATHIKAHPAVASSEVILIHFATHHENITWLWAVILAGLIPAISPPFVHDEALRRKHLGHIQSLLKDPLVLTSQQLVPELLDVPLKIQPVEKMSQRVGNRTNGTPHVNGINCPREKQSKPAVLMLTSGSTGNAKAMSLTHHQILHSIRGKIEYHGHQPSDPVLNWIGFDHVASLTETHLTAMALSANQSQVQATDLLADPLRFLRLLEQHKVQYTFAPNFFLSKVQDSLVAAGPTLKLDLSSLRVLTSAGEANNLIRPGFGMTETCAGSIYNLRFPSRDVWQGLDYAYLGTCMPGISMRVVVVQDSSEREAAAGEIGALQVSGPVVFEEYFDDPEATRQAFTPDGWFITGDNAYIDALGHLNMLGRAKDTINVAGVKWSCADIENAIEEEGIPGLAASWTVAFPARPPKAPTEQIAIVYRPAYDLEDASARLARADAIAKSLSLVTGKAPDYVFPIPTGLEKSSLGKISRSQLQSYRQSQFQAAETDMEKLVQGTLADLLAVPPDKIHMKASIFDLGVSSFNLIMLKSMLDRAVQNVDHKEEAGDVPLSTLLNDPSVDANLIHPGSGDILVFISLASHFSTRPVYALRTGGYNAGEEFFPSISESAQTYADSILKYQPQGPYAIAGYSLGSTLGHEVAKVLLSRGREVKFLASIDYPPHIRHFVTGLDFADVLLHVGLFYSLYDQETMEKEEQRVYALYRGPGDVQFRRDATVRHILQMSRQDRVEGLALDEKKMALIVDVAKNIADCGSRYEPVGKVPVLDVFVADPPMYAAKSRDDWRSRVLGKWQGFSETEVVWHECDGFHVQMLEPEYVLVFSKKLKAALKARGV
ncbi:NRPS-like enzyme [Diaporthe sp. PMI_573]|nr:NRPS-like enzyme [Diaporthaceae sp. PMI_573]